MTEANQAYMQDPVSKTSKKMHKIHLYEFCGVSHLSQRLGHSSFRLAYNSTTQTDTCLNA